MLTGNNLSFEVDTHRVFGDVDIAISNGDRVGLVGPNGAGKTSLLKILAGIIEPSGGEVNNNGLEVGMLPQDLRQWFDNSVYQFLEDVTGVKDAKIDFDHAEHLLSQDVHDPRTLMIYCDAVDRLANLDVDSFEGRVSKALKRAGLDESIAQATISELSGGQKTRVALSAILASKYDVILLDEPTNNLDIEGIVILEKFIEGSSASFLMVSHDRRFLRNATTRIIELLGGDNGVNQYGLGYDEYKEARDNAYKSELKIYEEAQEAIKSMKAAIRAAKVRANSAERGGSRRSDSDKLSANARAGRASAHLAGQAKSQASRLERMLDMRPSEPQPPIELNFMFKSSEIVNKQMITVADLFIEYEDGTIFGPYDFVLNGKDRIAIIGSNGVGKTTLIKSLTGNLDSKSGYIKISPDARIGYMDQQQTLPLPDSGLVENVSALAPDAAREDIIHILKKFNFTSDQVLNSKARDLSGGERAKTLLAAIAANKANVLILDEPTNNLDIPTIDGLQEAIKTFPGAILLISHDREFIDGIGIDHTIAL